MIKQLLLLSVLLPTIVMADSHLIMTIGSKHSEDNYTDMDGNTKPLNENNFGLGIGYDITNNVQLRGGFYENSYSKTSWYAGGSLHTDITKTFAIGVQGGVVTGYENVNKHYDYGVIQITALPFVQLRHKRVAVELGYMPDGVGKMGVFTLFATLSM